MLIAKHLFKFYLEPGEKLVAVFHRHPFVVFPELLNILIFGLVLPVFLWFLFPEFGFFWAIWGFISLLRVVNVFMIWYHDSLLITSISLVDVYWNSLFDRSSTRVEYPTIEAITCEIRGFIPTIFNYGTITVQKTGSGVPIVLKDAMNPRRAEREIMAYQAKFVSSQSFRDAESLKNIITSMVRQHANDQ